jgi:hypothetical protein
MLEQRFTLEALEKPRRELVECLRARVVRATNTMAAQSLEALPALAG